MKKQKEQLVQELSQILGKKRFTHSVSVAKNAAKLARLFAPECEQDAWIAGLLHDHAKKIGGGELIKAASRFDIEVSKWEKLEPGLLHGKVGAAMLETRFGIETPEVYQAVADHVTGRPKMGMVSKILFVADQIADDRNFDGVEELRDIARADLELAVLFAAKNKLEVVLSRRGVLLPATVDLYNAQLGIN